MNKTDNVKTHNVKVAADPRSDPDHANAASVQRPAPRSGVLRRRKKRIMWWIIGMVLVAVIVFGAVTAVQFRRDTRLSYERLASYDVETLDTEFGAMSYVQEGSGEAVLISHGIFGGYDQGMDSLRQLFGDEFRKISPSRFGYPGSSLPDEPTPANQARAFSELLDALEIRQAYILTTSAGGAAGLRLALEYPDRVKGLILLSSAVPDRPRDVENIKELGMTGPPAALVNNFAMWFSMRYFGFAFNAMMGSQAEGNTLYQTMLPASPRKHGIRADADITNIDMTLHFDRYPVERITAPILVVHAKDDPMAKYPDVERFLTRVNATTAIFETGGHLISGHGDAVGMAIRAFIRENG